MAGEILVLHMLDCLLREGNAQVGDAQAVLVDQVVLVVLGTRRSYLHTACIQD